MARPAKKEPPKNSVGWRIRKARNEKGLTQAGLAELCKWADGNSRVGNYEINEREPKLADFAVLAEALDQRIEWLAFGLEEPGAKIEGMANALTARSIVLATNYQALPNRRKDIVDLLLQDWSEDKSETKYSERDNKKKGKPRETRGSNRATS